LGSWKLGGERLVVWVGPQVGGIYLITPEGRQKKQKAGAGAKKSLHRHPAGEVRKVFGDGRDETPVLRLWGGDERQVGNWR